MTKTFRAFFLLTCAGFALAMSAVSHVGTFLSEAAGYARTLARHVVDVIAPATLEKSSTKVPLAQAKAFMQRIVKRERPVITGSWRMCPGV